MGIRKETEPSKRQATLDEIESTFGGFTLQDIPIIGSRIDSKTKKRFEDSHFLVWITAENNTKSMRVLKKLKQRWKKRFEQEEIMMYYITIDTL